MKKPEEIKKDIIDCMDEAVVVNETGDAHDLLDFADKAHVCMATALTYIQQLESSYSQVSKALCDKENATLDEILQAVSQAKTELEAVKRERDAAVKDLLNASIYDYALCKTCKKGKNGKCKPICTPRRDYEWRGVCPENAEGQEDE